MAGEHPQTAAAPSLRPAPKAACELARPRRDRPIAGWTKAPEPAGQRRPRVANAASQGWPRQNAFCQTQNPGNRGLPRAAAVVFSASDQRRLAFTRAGRACGDAPGGKQTRQEHRFVKSQVSTVLRQQRNLFLRDQWGCGMRSAGGRGRLFRSRSEAQPKAPSKPQPKSRSKPQSKPRS